MIKNDNFSMFIISINKVFKIPDNSAGKTLEKNIFHKKSDHG